VVVQVLLYAQKPKTDSVGNADEDSVAIGSEAPSVFNVSLRDQSSLRNFRYDGGEVWSLDHYCLARGPSAELRVDGQRCSALL
jgi:hypothetical protein